MKRDHNTFVCKNISLFIAMKGSKWLWDRLLEVYHWHRIGGRYSKPYLFCFLVEGFPSPSGWHIRQCVLSTCRLLSESDWISVFRMQISCHYIIFSTVTHFSFWFSIHVSYNCSFLFMQVHYPVYEIPN